MDEDSIKYYENAVGYTMSTFTEEDRRIFQVLIDHHLDSIETIAPLLEMGSTENARHYINYQFCEKYRCITRTQILDFGRIGLHPYFRITEEPLEDTSCLRQFKLFGTQPEYLSLCVTSDLARVPPPSKSVYPITQIYRPTNNINLLYEEATPLSFNDEWLLNLKEVMVDQEMGDVIYHQENADKTPIPITPDMLEQVKKVYLNDVPKLLDRRLREIVKTYEGFLSTYLDIKLPNMEDYILIMDNIQNPLLFIGGFIGRFPLIELYETPNALICRIQTPETFFSKFNLSLHTHLISVCTPNLWLLLNDERKFDLLDCYENGHWKRF